MPSFTAHIAIAKQYMKKHKDYIKNEEEFIKGSIAPDSDKSMMAINKNKGESHYGTWHVIPVIIDFQKFFKDKKVDLSQDFWKGYFLHLIADFYFYNLIFLKENKLKVLNKENFYNDFDIFNKTLIEKYEIEVMENIKKYMTFKEGETKYLNLEKMIDFIEKMSSLDMEDQEQKIRNYGVEELYNEFRS